MKKPFLIIGFIITVLFGVSFYSHSAQNYRSKYIGQEYREIKSLSSEDLNELRNGRGWGLAKAAELNGVPGPAHLLEMKEEINLTEKQITQIELLYAEMKKQAIQLGLKLIKLERELNKAFANRTIDEKGLRDLLKQIAGVNKELRYVHLSTHLKTPDILSSSQFQPILIFVPSIFSVNSH